MQEEVRPKASKSVPVTADNFIRAESDAVFTRLVARGGFGKSYHNLELTPADARPVTGRVRADLRVENHPA